MARKLSSLFRFSVLLGLFATGLFFTGCISFHDIPSEHVRYYDRNGDGKVDLEYHYYPGGADMDWELRDDNYDGRYEKKILYGYAVLESSVDIPVPTNVPISPNPTR